MGFKIACALLIATAALTSLASHPVLAKCQPNRTNDERAYFDGWQRSPAEPGGVYSKIFNYSPWVQPGRSVVAWTMLNRFTTQWAQVGWWEYAFDDRYTFTQTTLPAVSTHFFLPEPVGAYTYYTTLYNNPPGSFSYQVNGSTIDVQPANFVPLSAQIYGELNTFASQMPGGYALGAAEDFFDSHIWFSGAWQPFDGVDTNDDLTQFGNVKISTLDLSIWDLTCPN